MTIKNKNQKILLFSILAIFLLVFGFFVYQSFKKNSELGDGNEEELNEQQEETANSEDNEDEGVADNIKISEPDNLKCSIEDFAIKLSWSTPASGDNLTYKIYKKSENEEEFKKIAENIENTEYHDKTETDPYLDYSYYVTAKNSNGESNPSETVTCKIHTEVNYKNPSPKTSFLQRIFSIKKAMAACVEPSPSFDANKLVSDVDFINTSSMSVSGIQKFLESNNSVLADINPKRLCGTTTTSCTNTKTAAQLIYEAAVLQADGQPVGINAGAILVTLQKEQSLITKTSWLDNCSAGSSCPYPTLQYALDWAMGYSVYEDGTRIEELKGFKQQLLGVPGSWWGAPRSLRNNYNLGRGPYSYYLGDSFVLYNTTSYYCVPSSQTVKPTTKATMSLYRYTPHVFNGNYNFWYYWNKWKSWFPYQATSIWNFISSGSGITSKSKIYTTTTWDYSKSKFASGDVNGDSRKDIIALYNYGNATTGLWVFTKTDTGYSAKRWWLSGAGAWNWYSTNLQTGDVNNDNKDDIILTYKYSPTKISIWNFISSGSGISSYAKKYTSTTWNLSNTKLSHADVNGDGREDLVALYNYGNAKTGIWVFTKTAGSYTAKKWWESGTGAWNWYSTNLQTGDVNNDTNGDIVLTYKYSLLKISIWNFISSGSGISSYAKKYTSTTWNLSNTKLSHADVNGDGREDLVALYNYGNANTGIWVFTKTATSYSAKRWWLSNSWSWYSTNLQTGDVNGDTKGDIVPIYKY